MKTATNPKTGEKLVLVGDEWKPLTKTATNAKGQKAYLIGDEWVVDDDAAPLPQEAPQKAPVTSAEQIAGDPLIRFAGGAAEPVMGTVQGLANSKPMVQHPLIAAAQMLVKGQGGDKIINEKIAQLDQMKKRGMEAAGQEGTDWMGIAGNILSPVNMQLGKGVEAAKGLFGKMLQGGAIGGAYAYGQTVKEGDYADEKLKQVGTGTLVGALIPGGVEAVKGASNFIKGLLIARTEAGKQKLIGEYVNGLVGPDKEKVIAALKEAGELVPGSRPTAGEAVSGIPSATALAAKQKALESSATKIKPDAAPTSALFAGRRAEQEGAREAAINTVAKTKGELEEAIGQRTAQSMRDYGAAYDKAIKVDPKLAQLSTNPYFKDALPDAIKLADARGVDAKTDLTQFLHFVKISLDKQLTKNGDTALSNTERKEVQTLQKELVKWMGSKNELYDKARANFAEASVPINQMQVGQYLKEKLINPLETGERAGVFAQAMRDAPNTIKKSSGQTRFDDLGQVLTKDQKKTVDGVLADLKRQNEFTNLARKTNLGQDGKIVSEGSALPPMLQHAATITNWALKKLRHGTMDEVDAMMGKLMLEPKKLAVVMESVPSDKRNAVMEAIITRVKPENRAAVAQALMIGIPAVAATED